MTQAQEAARRAEASMERMTQRYGSIDLEEYNRLKAEAQQLKVGGLGRAGVMTGLAHGRHAFARRQMGPFTCILAYCVHVCVHVSSCRCTSTATQT